MDLDYLYEVRISVEEEILYHKEVTSTRFVDLLLRGNKLMNEAGVAFITEITIDWELDAFELAAQCWNKKRKWNLR